MTLKTKVCGMRDHKNIVDVSRLTPNFMGFIFYTNSPRDAMGKLQKEDVLALPPSTQPVGVFVNEEISKTLALLSSYGLRWAQLHGNESPTYCLTVKEAGFGVIKVFSLDENTDFGAMKAYVDVADYFLFDTKSPKHGGTGQKFDWGLLEKYTLKKPVFLSGGIGVDDAEVIKSIAKKHPWIAGVDLNSKFEIAPAQKDINTLGKFLDALEHEAPNTI